MLTSNFPDLLSEYFYSDAKLTKINNYFPEKVQNVTITRIIYTESMSKSISPYLEFNS